jgi:hypothetical protein
MVGTPKSTNKGIPRSSIFQRGQRNSLQEDWLASQPEDFRELHIPLPPATSQTGLAGFTHIFNPTQSGPNGREPYVDRLPCWIKVERMSLRIPYSQSWNSYIRFPMEDMVALARYRESLTATTHTVKLDQVPELSAEVRELYASLSQSYPELEFGPNTYITLCPDGEEDDSDEDGISPREFNRLLAPWNSSLAAQVLEEDRQDVAERYRRIRSWIEDFVFSEENSY